MFFAKRTHLQNRKSVSIQPDQTCYNQIKPDENTTSQPAGKTV
jgi:hypothetical protein